MREKPNQRSDHDDRWLGELLETPQQGGRQQRNQRGDPVRDRALADDDDCARDGTDSRSRDAVYESDDAGPLAVLLEVRGGQNRE